MRLYTLILVHFDGCRILGSFASLVATLYDDKYYTMMSVWLFGQPGSRLPTLLICKVNAIRTPLCTGCAVLCTLFNINQQTLFIPWFKQSNVSSYRRWLLICMTNAWGAVTNLNLAIYFENVLGTRN